MLTEMVKGRRADEVATMPRDELLEEVGIPLTPIRLKCALLGLGVLKVALHRAKGTPLPEEWAGLDELQISYGVPAGSGPDMPAPTRRAMAELDRLPVEELPPGTMKLVHAGEISVGVYNVNGRALRGRGPVLARRRAARRGRLGARRGRRHLPSPRLPLRHLHG